MRSDVGDRLGDELAGIEVIVDGEQTMDEVFADIQGALEGVAAGR